MKSYFHLAGISLATALIISCSGGGFDGFLNDVGNTLNQITGSNLLQNSNPGLGFMSSAEGIPPGDVDVIQDVQINGSALPGGSTSITVKSSKKLKELYLQIEGDERGYYVWTLEPEDEISTNPYTYFIVLEFNQRLEGDEELKFTVSGLTANNEIVEKKDETLKTKGAGKGALQISLSWDVDDDVDLHVWSPSEYLYYGNRELTGDFKAELDVDSNPGCNIDGIKSENIFFENPLEDGDYIVAVRLFRKCSYETAGARYHVTANLKGQFIKFGQQSGQFSDTDEYDVLKEIGTIRIQNGILVN